MSVVSLVWHGLRKLLTNADPVSLQTYSFLWGHNPESEGHHPESEWFKSHGDLMNNNKLKIRGEQQEGLLCRWWLERWGNHVKQFIKKCTLPSKLNLKLKTNKQNHRGLCLYYLLSIFLLFSCLCVSHFTFVL